MVQPGPFTPRPSDAAQRVEASPPGRLRCLAPGGVRWLRGFGGFEARGRRRLAAISKLTRRCGPIRPRLGRPTSPDASKRRFFDAFAASLPVAFVGGAASTQDRRRRNGRPPAARCDFKIGRAVAVQSVRARPTGAPRFAESSTYCAVVGPASLGFRQRPSVVSAAAASSQGSCTVRAVCSPIVPPRDDQPLPRRANRRLW